MAEPIQYITNAEGDRVGVVLDLASYERLTNPLLSDPDCLVGLSRDELQALVESMLAPPAQAELNELLARQANQQLSPEELATLDRLLERIDHLTLLKTRARYTLKQMQHLHCAA